MPKGLALLQGHDSLRPVAISTVSLELAASASMSYVCKYVVSKYLQRMQAYQCRDCVWNPEPCPVAEEEADEGEEEKEEEEEEAGEEASRGWGERQVLKSVRVGRHLSMRTVPHPTRPSFPSRRPRCAHRTAWKHCKHTATQTAMKELMLQQGYLLTAGQHPKQR